MKQILILAFLFCSLFATSQTYMNEVKAKDNPGVMGTIKRTNDQLKVSDSLAQLKLTTLAAAVTSNKFQVDVITMPTTTVSGTVTANQGGTWNINNISGTISLPTGASTSANQNTEITSLQLIDDIVHSGDATLSKYAVLGGVFDDVSPVAVTENNAQSLRMSSRRALYVETPSGGTFSTQATQSGTWNIGTITTLTGITNVVHIDDNASSLTVDGTVGATQSGTWNITNISGTVSLPTGASTEASLVKLTLTQGSTTSGQSGALIQGAVTTSAPSYTTAQTSPLSLQTDGSLRSAITNTVTVGTHAVTQSGTWILGANSGVDIGDVTINNGTGASAVNIQDGGNSITVDGTVSITSNSAVNISQINGVTPLMGNGVTGTGSPRVTIASDGTAISTTGYMSVKLDQTTLGTTNGVSIVPSTSGGYDKFYLVSAATTNATNIKASAGQVYGWYVFNANAAARKIMFHNTSGTPTAGASTYFPLVIPAGSGANVSFPAGIPFSSGIAITTTTGTADSDATAVAAGDLIITIFYK